MFSRTFLFGLLFCAVSPLATGQGLTANSGVAVYRYAEPGQNTKDIQVWGAVRNAGVYQVKRDTDLLTLLSLAGGPAATAESDRTTRTIDVRVIRDPDTARTAILETSLDDLLAAEVALPDLEDGDLVQLTVQTRQRFSWRDVLSITTSVASLTVLILRIVE